MDRREFIGGAVATAGGLFSGSAGAADGPLKFIYPYAPGSGGDILVREAAGLAGK